MHKNHSIDITKFEIYLQKSEATSSSESLIEVSDNPSGVEVTTLTAAEADDQTETCCCCGGLANEGVLPVKRASSLAILSGKEWSDWLEEFEEKCITMSSDIAKHLRTLQVFNALHSLIYPDQSKVGKLGFFYAELRNWRLESGCWRETHQQIFMLSANPRGGKWIKRTEKDRRNKRMCSGEQ